MIYIVFVCNRVIRIITCADVKPHGRFFLFGVIRIITCAGASRTDVFFLLGIKK